MRHCLEKYPLYAQMRISLQTILTIVSPSELTKETLTLPIEDISL